MASTSWRVSTSSEPVISLMSCPSIFAEYTKPAFLSPSILKVTVLPLGDCFVQTSIICPLQLCAAILVPELLTRQIRWSQCETRRGLRGRPPESVNHRHKFRSRNRDRKDEPRSQ